MATSYYQQQLETGQLYQDFIAHQMLAEGVVLVNYGTKQNQYKYGENALGLEIKFDMKFVTTNNLWIEVAERRDAVGPWVDSGVRREDNSWLYGIGNYEEFFIFSKRTLRILADRMEKDIRENDRKTSKGFLLSRAEAARFMERAFVWPPTSR